MNRTAMPLEQRRDRPAHSDCDPAKAEAEGKEEKLAAGQRKIYSFVTEGRRVNRRLVT